jgi:hypothetical protein
VAEIWRAGYREGIEDFTSLQEEEATYGHDWRG